MRLYLHSPRELLEVRYWKRAFWVCLTLLHLRPQIQLYQYGFRIRGRERRNLPSWKRTLLLDPCVYCGRPADTIDHITPRSKDGHSHWDNFAPACGPCNRDKGAQPLLMFLAKKVIPPPVWVQTRKAAKVDKSRRAWRAKQNWESRLPYRTSDKRVKTQDVVSA